MLVPMVSVLVQVGAHGCLIHCASLRMLCRQTELSLGEAEDRAAVPELEVRSTECEGLDKVLDEGNGPVGSLDVLGKLEVEEAAADADVDASSAEAGGAAGDEVESVEDGVRSDRVIADEVGAVDEDEAELVEGGKVIEMEEAHTAHFDSGDQVNMAIDLLVLVTIEEGNHQAILEAGSLEVLSDAVHIESLADEAQEDMAIDLRSLIGRDGVRDSDEEVGPDEEAGRREEGVLADGHVVRDEVREKIDVVPIAGP